MTKFAIETQEKEEITASKTKAKKAEFANLPATEAARTLPADLAESL